MRPRYKKAKRGFTLLEMLVTISVIVILAAVLIPSLAAIKRRLDFQEMNNYAKEIFMAAQNTLVERHVTGTLKELQDAEGKEKVPRYDNASFPEADYSDEYCYTTGGEALDILLPAGSIDPTLRGNNILIEYNPYTANVYAVFYSQKGQTLSYANVVRDEAARRPRMLGYYSGSGLSSPGEAKTIDRPSADLVNEQEAYLLVTVPIPEKYQLRPSDFVNQLTLSAKLQGEIVADSAGKFGSFELKPEDFANWKITNGSSVEYRVLLDSLVDKGSFASLARNNKDNTNLYISQIDSTDKFHIQPGENITATIQIQFDAKGDTPIEYDPVIVGGVNPMFEELEKVNVSDGSARCYKLHVKNGRQLQNINALSPLVAEKIKTISIDEDIYWNETVDFYNDKYASGGQYHNKNADLYSGETGADDRPARALPYFVPLIGDKLFGAAWFDGTDLTDNQDGAGRTADIQGGKHRICYLNIRSEISRIGKPYYATSSNVPGAHPTESMKGNEVLGKDKFAGLFAYLDTAVYNVYIVNPTVAGNSWSGGGGAGQPAVGALVGAAGHGTFIMNCRVYIDKSDKYFEETHFDDYRVTGCGAVGGLVGYAKSHKTTSDTLQNNTAYLSFSNCFAAIPVKGTMETGRSGYTNGVGGLIGVSVLTNFYNCYASGNVTGTGIFIVDAPKTQDAVKTNKGVGGFVGTSHGTKYFNCFATGAVEGDDWKGVGAFLGSGIYNEAFTYTGNGSNRRITQVSRFDHCYSIGTVQVKNDPEHKNTQFVGYMSYNASIPDTAGAPDDWRYTSDERTYLYRNTWYLYQSGHQYDHFGGKTQYEVETDRACADSCSFADLVHETGGYFYGVNNWEAAKMSTSHPYRTNGAVYPFSKIAYQSDLELPPDFDYYGDWPTPTLSAGIAYYEKYDGDPVTRYFFDETDVTLKKDGDRDTEYGMKNEAPYEEGYALLMLADHIIAKNELAEMGIQINDKPLLDFLKERLKKETVAASDYIKLSNTKPTVNKLEYQMFEFTPAFLNVLAEEVRAKQQFYIKFSCELDVKHADATEKHTFVMYFNPQFAMTQINPITVDYKPAKNPDKPNSIRTPIRIRSPRQYWELTRSDVLWGQQYQYRQDVNLDLGPNAYDWQKCVLNLMDTLKPNEFNDGSKHTYDNSIFFYPVGNSDVPFNGGYDAYSGYQTNAQLIHLYEKLIPQNRAKDPNTPNDRYGIFGVVGPDGTVRGLTVLDAEVTLSKGAKYGSLVVGENRGTVSGIQMDYTGASIQNVTLTPHEGEHPDYTGLVAAVNSGTITDCVLRVSGRVTLPASEAAGSFVGQNAGFLNGNTIKIGEVALTNAKYAGGILGHMTQTGRFGEKNTVSVYAVTGHHTVGGFAGLLQGELDNEDSFQVAQVTSDGIAAGFAGEVKDATIQHMAITVGSVTGKTGASGAFGDCTNLKTSGALVTVTVTGDISSDGSAAGAMLSVSGKDSAVSNIHTFLSGQVQATGDAAGLANTVGCSMQNCNVYFDGATVTGANAAGLCNTYEASANDNLEKSTVSGNGEIKGEKLAAGFANDLKDPVGMCGVTPVRQYEAEQAEAYHKAAHAQLTVSAPDAAGFANTIEDATQYSYTLCRVEGANPAGFVGTNRGKITGCQANVEIAPEETGGAAFAGTNRTTIKASYVWYKGSPEYSFVAKMEGAAAGASSDHGVRACYAALLDPERMTESKDVAPFAPKDAASIEDCFLVSQSDVEKPEDGTDWIQPDGVTMASYETMALRQFESDKEKTWVYDVKSKQTPYPCNEELEKVYPYPALRVLSQYGDWVRPMDISYGVAYYEISGADGKDVVTVWLCDAKTGAVGGNLDSVSAETQIQSAGYAIYVHNAQTLPEGVEKWESLTPTADAQMKLTKDETELVVNPKDYRFCIIPETTDVEAKGKITEQTFKWSTGEMSTYNPCFAPADEKGFLGVSTPVQLQNVAFAPEGSYAIRHTLDMSGVEPKEDENGNLLPIIGTFTGTLRTVKDASVQNLTAWALIDTLAENAKFSVDVKNSSMEHLICNAKGQVYDMTVSDCNVMGSIFGTVTGAGTAEDAKLTFQSVTLNNVHLDRPALYAEAPQQPAQELSLGLFADSIQNAKLSGITITGDDKDKDGFYPSILAAALSNREESALNVRAGILAGTITDSEITDVAINNVTQILRLDGENAAATVGGVVGYTSDSKFTKVNVSGDLLVDVPEKSEGMNLTATTGKFVGHADSGAFADCHASQPGEWKFAGEVGTNSGTVTAADNLYLAYTDEGLMPVKPEELENCGYERLKKDMPRDQIRPTFENCSYTDANGEVKPYYVSTSQYVYRMEQKPVPWWDAQMPKLQWPRADTSNIPSGTLRNGSFLYIEINSEFYRLVYRDSTGRIHADGADDKWKWQRDANANVGSLNGLPIYAMSFGLSNDPIVLMDGNKALCTDGTMKAIGTSADSLRIEQFTDQQPDILLPYAGGNLTIGDQTYIVEELRVDGKPYVQLRTADGNYCKVQDGKLQLAGTSENEATRFVLYQATVGDAAKNSTYCVFTLVEGLGQEICTEYPLSTFAFQPDWMDGFRVLPGTATYEPGPLPEGEATEEPTEPTEETTEPTEETTEPTEETTEPTEETTEPTEETTEPTEGTTEPTEETTEPTEETTEPTEGTTEPTEGTTEPTEPTTEATEPAPASVSPVTQEPPSTPDAGVEAAQPAQEGEDA